MLGLNYGGADDPLAILRRRERGAISVYARGDDYHDVIKPRLKTHRALALAAGRRRREGVRRHRRRDGEAAGGGRRPRLAGQAHQPGLARARLVAVPGRDLHHARAAARCRRRADHCGSCRACLDICPTAAFPAPYRLDARRCISYLTIEHKGPIPRELRPLMGNRIFGCDDCLAVCPWNKYAQAGHEAKLAARDALQAPPLADLAGLDEAAFRALFAKSPVKRAGRDRFVRNVLIAIGNSADPALAGAAERLLARPVRPGARRRHLGARTARPRPAARGSPPRGAPPKPIRRSRPNGRRRSEF